MTSMVNPDAGSPPQEIGTRVHLKSLDGLRGLALLLVFYFHCGPEKPIPILHEGAWAGVDLFFVLSGFLITGILLDTRGHANYFKNFYARRALRIFPLYYGVLLVLLLLTPVLHTQWSAWEVTFPIYASNFGLHFADIGHHSHFDIQHFWSLAVEEQFYFLWPLVISLVQDRRKLSYLCLGLMIVSPMLRTWIDFYSPIRSPYDFNYVMLPTRMDALLTGGLLAILVRSDKAAYWLRYLRWSSWVWLALMIGMLGITHSAHPEDPLMNTVGLSLLALFFASLIAHALVPAGLISRLFRWSWLRSIGKYSYGMYVYHELFRPSLYPVVHLATVLLHSLSLGHIAFFFGWLLTVYSMAWLSYTFFESRFIHLKRYFPYAANAETQVEPAPAGV